MDIHKPEPWRGWREFIKEIGTIVIGVLIALGAEQAVETLHWRHVVEQERENLRTESAWNQQTMYARLQIEPCVARRLAELDELFSRHRHGKPLGQIAAVGRPAYWTGGNQAWDLALSDQAVAHMPQKDKTLYTALAQVYGSYDGTRLEERAAWRDLQVLDHADDLSPADWSSARKSLAAAHDSDEQMRIHIRDEDWLGGYRGLGLPRAKPDARVMAMGPIVALCRPMLAQAQPQVTP